MLGLGLWIGLLRQNASIPNLLASIAWTRGLSTTMTIANSRVRVIRAGANPRVYKRVPGLTVGATYRLAGGSCFAGTQTGSMFLRASTSTEIPNGDLDSASTDFAINHTFVAGATTMYVGMVCIATNDGEYAEISEGITLTRVN